MVTSCNGSGAGLRAGGHLQQLPAGRKEESDLWGYRDSTGQGVCVWGGCSQRTAQSSLLRPAGISSRLHAATRVGLGSAG